MEDEQRELLGIYRIHVELADRVSERRDGANRLYASLLTGVLVLVAASLRFGTGMMFSQYIPIGVGILGSLLSVSWFIVIRSYRQLNSGKFSTLHELEEKLCFPFFQREWEFLGEGKSVSKYWKLTIVETFLPLGFLALSLGSLILGFVAVWKSE